jgi:hypothetical protein
MRKKSLGIKMEIGKIFMEKETIECMLKGVEICLQSKDGRNFRGQDTMYKTWR